MHRGLHKPWVSGYTCGVTTGFGYDSCYLQVSHEDCFYEDRNTTFSSYYGNNNKSTFEKMVFFLFSHLIVFPIQKYSYHLKQTFKNRFVIFYQGNLFSLVGCGITNKIGNDRMRRASNLITQVDLRWVHLMLKVTLNI